MSGFYILRYYPGPKFFFNKKITKRLSFFLNSGPDITTVLSIVIIAFLETVGMMGK